LSPGTSASATAASAAISTNPSTNLMTSSAS
jgi:hypothetical protein